MAAAILFVGKLRRQLATPGPYVAAAVALILFSPFVVWNALHGWPHLEFMKNATAWGTALPFLAKMVLVVASAATILPLRTYVSSSGAGPTEIGDRARLLAIASIVTWSAAVTAGRLLAYLVP